ncbi:MAG: trehalose-phosphatase [Terriglobales bacterium]
MDDPGAAVPLPGIVEVLTELAARRDLRVAVVSGRSLEDVRTRCPVPGCWYVGGHGNETSAAAAPINGPAAGLEAAAAPAPVNNQAVRRRLGEIAAQVAARLPQWPGVRLEAKPFSLAAHFRQAPQWEAPLRALLSRLASGGEFRLLSGRQVIELLPAAALTKGHAVERLRSRLNCDLAFYFGDDATDEDVFRLPDARLIGVKVASAETPGPTAAAYRVASPGQVLSALREIAELRQAATTGIVPGKK